MSPEEIIHGVQQGYTFLNQLTGRTNTVEKLGFPRCSLTLKKTTFTIALYWTIQFPGISNRSRKTGRKFGIRVFQQNRPNPEVLNVWSEPDPVPPWEWRKGSRIAE